MPIIADSFEHGRDSHVGSVIKKLALPGGHVGVGELVVWVKMPPRIGLGTRAVSELLKYSVRRGSAVH